MWPQQAIIYESYLLVLIGIFRLFYTCMHFYCSLFVRCTRKESAHVLIILYTLLLLYTIAACFSIKLYMVLKCEKRELLIRCRTERELSFIIHCSHIL